MPEFELIAACWTTAGGANHWVLTTEARADPRPTGGREPSRVRRFRDPAR